MSFQFNIQALDKSLRTDIQTKIDQKTKPPGSLGQLETLALKIAQIQGKVDEPLNCLNPVTLVFAGDHGIAQQGISIAPSDVTAQMVQNFFAGGAAINAFCNENQCQLVVVNSGVKAAVEIPEDSGVAYLDYSVGQGTQDFSKVAAMSQEQLASCFDAGREVVQHLVGESNDVIALGEMGIGNTTSAALIFALLCEQDVRECVGRGTGINDAQFLLKQVLAKQTQTRVLSQYADNLTPIDTLREVGGFEIAQMTAAMLALAEKRKIILVDGFICSAAALLACKLFPAVQDYMVFCHCSEEQAHKSMLSYLNEKPLLDLGLRLGEGSGAVLALPLLKSACAFYNQMATFQSAGVEV